MALYPGYSKEGCEMNKPSFVTALAGAAALIASGNDDSESPDSPD